MARTRLYRSGTLVAEDFPVDDISEHLADEHAVVCLDLTAPGEGDFEKVGEQLGLHALAVEDALSEHERAKLNHYASHLFMTAYVVRFDADTGEVHPRELSVFITQRALITVHRDDDIDIGALTRRWDETSESAGHGVAFLLHGLLDLVVDGHFEVVQSIDQALEELEDTLFTETPESIRLVQRRSFRLRKSITTLRKVVLPMREVVSGLMRPNAHVVDESMVPYYQDVLDHTLRVGEWTESLRDFVTAVLDTNLTVQGNRLNTIMKKVTSWAAIIAVPTAVTGFYGQNVPYPGYEHHAGLVTSTALIVVLSAGLYLVFKRKDWL